MTNDARRWPMVEVVDPSMTRGLFVCWFQMDQRTERWYMVHAKNVPDGPISIMVDGIKRERMFVGKDPEVAIMDNKGGKHIVDKEKQESWFQRFRNHGLIYEPNDEPADLEELVEWLTPRFDPVLEREVPKLLITQRVAELERGPLWALQRFRWDPFMSRKDLYEQPGKDWIDCMKYLVNQKSVNKHRLRRQKSRWTQASRTRHEKLARSYQWGGSGRSRAPSLMWTPPRYR